MSPPTDSKAGLEIKADDHRPGKTPRTPQVSVVVCTYNRADYLRWVLPSLLRQSIDSAEYEILVVDNNSGDGTQVLVNELAQDNDNLRYVFEPKQGLSNARNRGFREARGEYVGFIDDDARAAEDWLENALRCFRTLVPTPQAIGGPCLPLYLGKRPDWFEDSMEAYDWGTEERFLLPGECFYGSNMFFDFSILGAVPEGFDPRLGVTADRLLRGEDDAFFKRLWMVFGDNARFYYSPTVRIFHSVPQDRMTLSYRVKRAFTAGQSNAVDSDRSSRGRRVREGLWATSMLLKEPLRALWIARRASSVRGWIARDVSQIAYRAGFFLGIIGIKPIVRRGL